MPNFFADLPELLDIASDSTDSMLVTPATPQFPGQHDPMVITSPTVPFEAYGNLEQLDAWRGATYRLRANGITGTPPISDFITPATHPPAFASAPNPATAPAVSIAQTPTPANTPVVQDFVLPEAEPCYMCEARGYEPCFVCRAKGWEPCSACRTKGYLLVGDRKRLEDIVIPRPDTPSTDGDDDFNMHALDREPRPYSVPGITIPRYDAVNAVEVPVRAAPLAIEWTPMKSPINRITDSVPRTPTPRPLEQVFQPGDGRRLRHEDNEITRNSSMFETMSAFQAIGHAYISTINKLYSMSDDERECVMMVLNELMPLNYKPQAVEAVLSVIRVAIHVYGIDYKLKLRSGREIWLRDIDLWRSPNARVTVLHYWTTRRATISVADIDRLLTLPQYSAQDGQFLINLRHKLKKGIKNPVPTFADLP